MADFERVVVAYSGGIDSTVLLYDLRAQGVDVIGFGVDYGQRHRRELAAAKAICADLTVEYIVATVDAPFMNSELTDGRGGVVVPNRNMMLISLAAATAVSHGAQAVAVGCHAGDAGLFPDCRPAFLDAAWQVLRAGTGIGLLRPFVRLSKQQIVERGIELDVPFDRTWSCYRGEELPCGECLACTERHAALHPFVLERAENPHPRMLAGAKLAQIKGGDYWHGYMTAMADATGEPAEDLLAWVNRR